MRNLGVVFVVIVAFAFGVLTCVGCAPKPVSDPETPVTIDEEPAAPSADATADDDPADDGEETEEEELARGREVLALLADASELSVEWFWDAETPIDGAAIPDAPAEANVEGKAFIVENAIIGKDVDDETDKTTWEIRFLDTAPEPGDETDKYVGDRFIELTVPDAGEGVVVEIPVGSDEWDINNAWFWYQTPREDSPDGISVNPGDISVYLEFTEWDETPSADNADIAGTAKGKIGIGSSTYSGSTCWLAGTFEAYISAD